MQRYLIKLSYDGTNFSGWQKQLHKRTVQEELEKALTLFAKTAVKVTGSGRTDTGVHALGQSAHVDYSGSANADQLLKGLSRLLPPDIALLRIFPVGPDFHARYDAFERHYLYKIAKAKSPFMRFYYGYFPHKHIHPDKIRQSLPYFLGKHDFSSFCKHNPDIPDRICEVKEILFTGHEEYYELSIRADRFLHNMVRRIIGALVNISHLNLEPKIISAWLKEKNPRQKIIFTAPPQGLYLADVLYPPAKIIPS